MVPVKPGHIEVSSGEEVELGVFPGEEIRFQIPAGSSALVRLPNTTDYADVSELTCTTHRLQFFSGNRVVFVRMSHISEVTTRGGFLKSKKIVLPFRELEGYLEIRLPGRDTFDKLFVALSSVLAEKRWSLTGASIAAPTLGGISRLMARMEQAAGAQSMLIDSGLSDLESMRRKAEELSSLIANLKRGSSDVESSEIDALLTEFGLLNLSDEGLLPRAKEAATDSSIAKLVIAAVESADRVILVHDLFCLINRRLKLERIFTPKEFLAELSKIRSIEIISICGYKVVVSLRLPALHDLLLNELQKSDGQSEDDLSVKLRVGNRLVFHLLLLKIEESFGKVVRDETPELTAWYLNVM